MRVVERLGQGGFGNVDKVQLDDGTFCARKTFAQNQALTPELLVNVQKRFTKEVKVQTAISHPNIVPIIGSDLNAEPPFYLMPLASSTLDKDLLNDRTLGGDYIAALSDIVAALEEMHSMQIFHRDLKPQNVLRYDTPGKKTYAVSDFGLVSMKESSLSELTTTGMGKGSDYYTAPEIHSDMRKASARSDVYSLGCILHEMVGAEPRIPFREIRESGPFAAVLLGCTKDDPSKRFSSAKSVLDALLTVDFQPSGVLSKASSDFANVLGAGDPPDAGFWNDLAEHLEKEASPIDITQIFALMSADRILNLCSNNREAANRIGMIFAEWVSTRSFNFEHCDAIANRVDLFFLHGDLELKVECMIALLEMGTSHNRWYVEHKFVEKAEPNMDEALAKRFAIKLFVEGSGKICSSINHLERSISFNRTSFHPKILEAVSRICGNV